MIPEFNESGDLPVGGHSCTWQEFSQRFETNDCRKKLCELFRSIIDIARGCGFIKVLIGGSFPTAKPDPNDMDLTWVTHPNVTKETVRPECVKLMEDSLAADEYGWNMQYLAIGDDSEKIQFWALQFGFDFKNSRDRGMLILDL